MFGIIFYLFFAIIYSLLFITVWASEYHYLALLFLVPILKLLYEYVKSGKFKRHRLIIRYMDNRIWLALVAIALSLSLILPFPYGVYQLIKIPLFGITVFNTFRYFSEHSKKQPKEFWILLILVIVFNPILPFQLYYKSAWIITDIVSACVYAWLIGKWFRKK